MNLTELTPTELRTMIKNEPEAVVAAILEGETISDVNLVKDKDGNSTELTEVVRDALTGNLISSQRITWTYYDAKAGVVKDIDVQVGNQMQRIEHYTDGRQPKMVTITKPDPIKPDPREL